jgi:hypothetical protein
LINLRAYLREKYATKRDAAILMKRYVNPASPGTTASYVTAEKVDRPPQKPGRRKYRSSVIPRLSIKTINVIARKIESKLAARVPGPLEGIISDRNQRRSVPKTPPNETSSTGFSCSPTS